MPPSAPRWIEYQAVSEVVPAARNPKGHDTQAITASMRRLGYTEPVRVDERTGRLISGHGRVESLAALEAKGEPPPEGIEVDSEGRWTIPVVRGWRSENDIEANMALVGANALTMAGGWADPAQLVELLQEAAAGPGLSGSGYNLTTLHQRLSDLAR